MEKIKTKPWQRQLQIVKASALVGVETTAKVLSHAFLPAQQRKLKNQQMMAEQADYLVNELAKLKGSAVKIGQIMAIYGEHLLPNEILIALQSLEQKTIEIDWQSMQPILIKALADEYTLLVIDPVPIGAASLAQVYKATYKASGLSICLKVQYPGVVESIESDFKSIARLLRLGRRLRKSDELDLWLDEVKQLLAYEIDYEREAKVTQLFAEKTATDPILKVPTIYDQLSTASMLVSSYEPGFAVNDKAVQSLSLARRNRLARAFLQLFFKEVFDWGMLQTDPNFGNYRIQIAADEKDRLVLLDFGAVLDYPQSFLQPVKDMLIGAVTKDNARIKQGAIDLGIMATDYPDEVHQDFMTLCYLLVEPFQASTSLPDAFKNQQGHYCWAKTELPKRAAKLAAQSAISPYFATPPKEFLFLSRKLLGVYRFIGALKAEFSPQDIINDYLD